MNKYFMKINKGSIFYTAAILTFANIFLQAIGFVYRVLLSSMAGTEALGVYRLVMQLYSVMLLVCTNGVCLVSTNKSASNYSLGNNAKIKRTINMCFVVFLMLFIMFTTCITIFPDFIAENILGDIRTKKAVYIMLVCIFLTGIENIIKSSLIGIKKVKYTAFSEVCEQILRVLFVLGLVYIYGDDDYGKIAFLIVLGMTLSEVFSVLFLGVCYSKIYKTKEKCSDSLFVEVSKIALPVSAAAFLNNIIASASTVLLPQRLMVAGFTKSEALSELGIISSIAMPILILPIALISSYSVIVMPNISKSKSVGDRKNIIRKINKSFEATGFIAIPATVFLVLVSIPLGRILFAVNFSMKYMAMLGICVIFTYYQIITTSILNGLGNERKAIFHSVIGEVIQLIITIFLCADPKFNIYGYIIGMIASPLIVSSLNMIHIFKTYRFNFIKFILNPCICGLFIYLSTATTYTFVIGVVGSQTITTATTMLIGVVVYFLMLRVVGVDIVKYIGSLKINSDISYKFK